MVTTFVIVHHSPRYHHSTDAIIGSYNTEVAYYGTLAKAVRRLNELSRTDEWDSHHSLIRKTNGKRFPLDLNVTCGYYEPNPFAGII